MNIKIKPSELPIMPDYLLPENFNRKQINAGIKNAGQAVKKKAKNKKKRKATRRQKRKNR